MQDAPDLTVLIRRWAGGDEQAAQALWQQTYDTLRALAHGAARGPLTSELESAHLVDAAWEKLARGVDASIADRSHFKALVARAMRQVAVEHVRNLRAAKREGALARQPLDDVVASLERSAGNLIDLHAALDALQALDPELAGLIDRHYFAGQSCEEIGAELSLSTRTVERRLKLAKGWLSLRLHGTPP